MNDPLNPIEKRTIPSAGHDELCFDGIPVTQLAHDFGTPLYVYSARYIAQAVGALRRGIGSRRHLICYSVKANSNLGVLGLLGRLDCGADIVSGGELFRALQAGLKSDRIVFAGVGKTEKEMEEAIKAGILYFSVESEEELDVLNRTAVRAGRKAHVSLRVNPDVDPKTHPYISTGLRENKFGIPRDRALDLIQRAAKMDGITPTGIGFHIGSQLVELDAFAEAAGIIKDIAERAAGLGADIQHIGVGGGLGVSYGDEQPPIREDYARMIVRAFPDEKITLVFEPGRSLVANAGVLLTRVLYRKENDGRRFFICDAAMNDLIRPSLYEAHHEVLPAIERGRLIDNANLVGPICESGDFIAKDRGLPAFEQGDVAVIMGTGAYGFSMASNYNSRLRAAEVLVENGKPRLVRRRENYEDLVRAELDI